MIGAMIWEMTAGSPVTGARTEAEAAQVHAGPAPRRDNAAHVTSRVAAEPLDLSTPEAA